MIIETKQLTGVPVAALCNATPLSIMAQAQTCCGTMQQRLCVAAGKARQAGAKMHPGNKVGSATPGPDKPQQQNWDYMCRCVTAWWPAQNREHGQPKGCYSNARVLSAGRCLSLHAVGLCGGWRTLKCQARAQAPAMPRTGHHTA